MDDIKIKKVLEYIDILNERQDIFPKKQYDKLIKHYSKYTKILHTLPKKDIISILKNKMDYEENKDRLNKIAEKYFTKQNKVTNHQLEKKKKSCKRYYGNKSARAKEDNLLKTLNKKSRRHKFIVFQRNLLKKNCKNIKF